MSPVLSNDGRFKQKISMEKFTSTGMSLDKDDKSRTALMSETQQHINSLNGDLLPAYDKSTLNMNNGNIDLDQVASRR